MDLSLRDWLDVLFRWGHVIAGVMWIGHLWFFNFVNSQLAKTYDAESKKKVIPELMPRALFFFRWGAAWTWITGLLLLGMLYYTPSAGLLIYPDADRGQSHGLAAGVGLVVVLFSFFVYDILWKSPLAKNEMAAGAVSFVLAVAATLVFSKVMSGRAAYIHLGGMFGTIMAMNVWMRIWPNQRKIIAAVKAGTAPDAPTVAMAGLRSKHNTYMSVPLLFAMVSNHFPGLYGADLNWVFLAVFIAVGWGITKRLYAISATPGPAQY
jgi:uncharacterized membrane protein